MRLIGPKCKYIFISILLLGVFLCGYNSKQWYVTNHRTKKDISPIYSCSKDKIGHGRFEEFVKQEFKAQGIELASDEFYLDRDRFDQKVEMEYIGNYLEILKTKLIGLILVVGDQAAFSLLSTRHRLLYSIPVVACNVYFPDENLIKEYESRKVYVLRDAPGFKRNMDFIKSL